MTNLGTITRDGAIALVPIGVVAVIVGGWPMAAGALIAGVVALVNLWLVGKLSGGFVTVAAGDGEGMAPILVSLGFMVKVPLTLCAFGLLVYLFDPLAVIIGISAAPAALGTNVLLSRLLPAPIAPQES